MWFSLPYKEFRINPRTFKEHGMFTAWTVFERVAAPSCVCPAARAIANTLCKDMAQA